MFREMLVCANRVAALLVIPFFPLNAADPASVALDHPEWEVSEVAPGVRAYQRNFDSLFAGPQVVNILRIDENIPGVKVRVAAAPLLEKSRTTVSEIGERSGAVAAINGGFAHGGPEKWNSGILKINDEVLPFLKREPEELRFVGGGAIGIDRSGDWHFRERDGETWDEDWPEMKHALAGGHLLLREGELHESIAKEEFGTARERRHAGGRHPRTGIGLRNERELFLVTVDGRHEGEAEGMTLNEFARFMRAIGAACALNLDGGGSTTMWIAGRGVVNYPSDNGRFDRMGARRVRTGMVVLLQE